MNSRTRSVRAATRSALVLMLALGIVLGVELASLVAPAAPRGATRESREARTTLWTCGMHPQVIQDHPGLCPICHMALMPLDATRAAGELTIDPLVRQEMGLRTAPVVSTRLARTLRAFGTLVEPEPNHRDVTLRVGGWIEKLFAATDGMSVHAGDPLFEIYSPELTVAIEELIAARAELTRSPDSPVVRTLHEAARHKLEVLGLSPGQIDDFERAEHAPATVTFLAPLEGHVTASEVYAGAQVAAGQRVLRLADNRTMWVDLHVAERDLATIAVGTAARVHVDSLPAREIESQVTFVHPHLDMATRTALVRLEVDNATHELHEGMYADARLDLDAGAKTPVVPSEAIIDTGLRRIAFVALDGGRFEPRDVEVGLRGDDGRVQVLSGLTAGETVVVSGQFLLDAESRTREAIRKHIASSAERDDAQHVTTGSTPHAHGSNAESESAAPSTKADDETKHAKSGSTIDAKTVQPEIRAEIDAFFTAYIAIAERLGGVGPGAEDFDSAALVAAARALSAATDPKISAPAALLATAAERLSRAAHDERRTAFAALSESVIAFADVAPPGRGVAPKLFVVHCPMAPGSWLQTRALVANPLFASTMKSCGEIVRTIPAAEER